MCTSLLLQPTRFRIPLHKSGTRICHASPLSESDMERRTIFVKSLCFPGGFAIEGVRVLRKEFPLPISIVKPALLEGAQADGRDSRESFIISLAMDWRI